MANGFVNQQNNAQATNGLTIPTANTLVITAGNLLVGAVSCNQNTTATFTDGGGNTYSQIGVRFDSTTGVMFGLFYAWNVAAGTYSGTCTYGTSSANRAIYWAQYSGVSIAADPLTGSIFPTNAIVAAPGTGTDAISSGGVIPVTTPCLIWSFCAGISNTVAAAAGTGFSGNASTWANISHFARGEDRIYAPGTAPTSQAATFTANAADGADSFNIGMAMFMLAMPDMTSRGICVGA